MKSRMMEEMTWKELDEYRKNRDLIIIPTGACEIYGSHLPMGTDTIVIKAFAKLVAEKINAVVAPCSPVADCSALSGYPGTVSVSEKLFCAYIEEVMNEFLSLGFQKFLFLTGHGANVGTISRVARKYQLEKGIRWAQIDFWRYTDVCGKEIFDGSGQMAHGHAGECAASIMLYLCPQLVDLSKAAAVFPEKVKEGYEGIEYFKPMDQRSPDGTIGDPTTATAEKGEKILKECAKRIAGFVKAEWENFGALVV